MYIDTGSIIVGLTFRVYLDNGCQVTGVFRRSVFGYLMQGYFST